MFFLTFVFPTLTSHFCFDYTSATNYSQEASHSGNYIIFYYVSFFLPPAFLLIKNQRRSLIVHDLRCE